MPGVACVRGALPGGEGDADADADAASRFAAGGSGVDRNWRACFLKRSSHETVCGGGFVGKIAMRSCPDMRGGILDDVEGAPARDAQSAAGGGCQDGVHRGAQGRWGAPGTDVGSSGSRFGSMRTLETDARALRVSHSDGVRRTGPGGEAHLASSREERLVSWYDLVSKGVVKWRPPRRKCSVAQWG